MRIDIGHEGRIVGTKRVANNGQVGGLESLAGKDVLIVVPEGRAEFRFGAGDYLHEWQKLARKNARRATKELRALRARIPAPQLLLKRARRELTPARLAARIPTAEEARALIEERVAALRKEKRVKQAEKWIRARVRLAGSRRRRAPAAA